MLKEKHDSAKFRDLVVKRAKSWLVRRVGRQVYEDLNRKAKDHSRRRRNRIKARRFLIKADCAGCRQEYLPQLEQREQLNIDLEKRYQPFDDYICQECKWYMRRGSH